MIEFIIGLTDKVSQPAKQAAGSLSQAAQQAKVLQDAMKALEVQAVKASALGDKGQLAKLTGDWDKYSAALKALQPQLDAAASQSAQAAPKFDLAGAALEKLGGAAGIAKMGISLYAAVFSAAVAALAEGARLSLEASEFKKSTLASFAALTGSAKAGEDVLKTIRQLEGMVPETEAQLVDAAKGLVAQGLDPSKLKTTLLSLSTVAAAVGEEGAQKIQNLIAKSLTEGKFKLSAKSLVGTGVTEDMLAHQMGLTPEAFRNAIKRGTIGAKEGIDALNAVIQQRMGGALEEKMNTLGAASAKFKDSLRQIFEDVNTGPLVAGVRELGKIFDQNTASGRALKFLMTQLFDGLFKGASAVLPYVRAFMLGIVAGALRFYIALKPVIAQFATLSGHKPPMSLMDFFFKMGEATFAAAAGIVKVIGYLIALGQATAKAYTFLRDFVAGAGQVATNFVQGLVNGIENGTGMVIEAVRHLGSSALSAIKGALGIASPSKEMAKIGHFSGAGLVQGMTAANDNVAAAASGMGQAALGGAADGAAPSGGGGVTVNVGGIVINGASDPAGVKAMLENEIALLFERLALTQGLGNAA